LGRILFGEAKEKNFNSFSMKRINPLNCMRV
jgi:hypothetical protein